MLSLESSPIKRNRLLLFGLILLANSFLYMFVGLVELPISTLKVASIVVSVLAVSLPIVALYVGASMRWSWYRWGLLCLFGFALQFGLTYLESGIKMRLEAGIVFAFSQEGLIMWCLGLGGLIACAIRDKNLLLPLAAFLAIFDFWLVFVPEGPVGRIARGNQESLQRIAYAIPSVAHVSHGGHAAPLAYVGPADFMFLGMFFVALFRFNMRTRATFRAVMPVLAIYLLIVLFAGGVQIGPVSLGALPALVPIGATVLIVNRKEFKLTRDEKISSAIILVAGVLLVGWRISIAAHHPEPEPQPAPLQMEGGPAPKGPPNLRRRLQEVQPKPGPPPAPGSRSGPP